MKMAPENGEGGVEPDTVMTELKAVTESRNEFVSAVGGRLEDLNADSDGLISFLSQPSVEVQPVFPLSFPFPDDELTSVYENCIMDNAKTMEGTMPGWDPETTERKLKEYNSQSEVSEAEAESSKGEVEFMPLKYEKERNPNYLVEKNFITTKINCAVSFQVKGSKVGQEIHIAMQYADLVLKQSPVKACKIHRSENPDKLPREFCFYIINEQCKYLLKDGHPTAVIPIKVENQNVAVAFLCLNSCHRKQGKLTDLVMALFDPDLGIVKKQHFSLRVCMNVKRDHKELKRLATDTVEGEPVTKCGRQEMNEMDPHVESKPVVHPQTLPDSQNAVLTSKEYYLISLSAEQREALSPLLKLIGVDEPLKVNISSSPAAQ